MQSPPKSQTAVSLAMLSAYYNERKQQDYVDLFIPFLATWLCTLSNQVLPDIKSIRDGIEKDYGLRIPLNPMKTILRRAEDRGLIKKQENWTEVIKTQCSRLDFSKKASVQYEKQEVVIAEFIKYCREKYDLEVKASDAEGALIGYLRAKDVDLLYFNHGSSLLPKFRTTNEIRFLFNSFLKQKHLEGSDTFKIIAEIAIGHILANCLVLKAEGGPEGKIKSLAIYVDTNLIFSLLGIDGKERRDSTVELFESLSSAGAKLLLFRHAFSEMLIIFEGARHWIESGKYDASMASGVARHFKDNFSFSEIDTFISTAEEKIKANKIDIVNVGDPNEKKHFQIDESVLFDRLKKHYKLKHARVNEDNVNDAIRRDTKSVAEIYKLREGKVARTLKDAKAFLVTSNASFAKDCLEFEREQYGLGKGFHLGLCVTDVFLGTLVWIYDRKEINEFMQKKLIADCYAALAPDEKTLQAFLSETRKLREKGRISDGEFAALTETPLVRSMLSEKVMGVADKVNSSTPLEILDALKAMHISEVSREHDGKVESLAMEMVDLKKMLTGKAEAEQTLAEGLRFASKLITVGLYLTIAFMLALMTGYAVAKMTISGEAGLFIGSISFILLFGILYMFAFKKTYLTMLEYLVKRAATQSRTGD